MLLEFVVEEVLPIRRRRHRQMLRRPRPPRGQLRRISLFILLDRMLCMCECVSACVICCSVCLVSAMEPLSISIMLLVSSMLMLRMLWVYHHHHSHRQQQSRSTTRIIIGASYEEVLIFWLSTSSRTIVGQLIYCTRHRTVARKLARARSSSSSEIFCLTFSTTRHLACFFSLL